MDMFFSFLTILLLGSVVKSNFILTGFSSTRSSISTTAPLRGEEPGNIWNPPVKGANKIPCGGLQDLPRTFGQRLPISAGADFIVYGSMLDSRGLGALSFQIKYGNNPDFAFSGGFSVGPTLQFDHPKSFNVTINQAQSGSYSGLATVQVIYTAGTSSYYQCIDVIMAGQQPTPSGFSSGFGPQELLALSSIQLDSSGNVVDIADEGLSSFHIALIVLVPLVCILGFYLCYRVCYPADDDAAVEHGSDLKNAELPPEPTFTKTKKSASQKATPTKPTTTSTKSHSKTATSVDNDAADPRGAHFHFQYV